MHEVATLELLGISMGQRSWNTFGNQFTTSAGLAGLIGNSPAAFKAIFSVALLLSLLIVTALFWSLHYVY